MEKELRTAAAYIRVSTDRQEELSPAAQKRELQKYAKNNGILITDFYQDDGISGRKATKRPEFQKMISLAKSPEHPYDYILVWKFSRFARNQEESIVYKSLLRKNNVEVVSITEPLIDGPFASLIERIIEWMDEYYSIRLAGDVKRGMTEKALRGGYQSVPPIGYRMNKLTKIPELYEPEANIVHMIFKLCLEENNLTTIARLINDAGHLTRRGNPFEARTVYYILTNPFYIGMVRWNRAKHGNYIPNDDNDIIIVQGKHEALIPKHDFEKAQILVAKHKPGLTGTHRRRSDTLYKHYLCGFMKCPVCGSNLAYSSAASIKYPYFYCWKYSKGMHKKGGHINAKRCEDALLESLSSLIRTGADSIDFHVYHDNKTPKDSNMIQYQKALHKIIAKEKRIREAYIEGIDTKDEYRENKAMIQKEKNRLEKLIAKEEKILSSDKIIQSPAEYIQVIKDIVELLQSPDVDTLKKHKALEAILEKMIYYRDSDTFEFFYKYS